MAESSKPAGEAVNPVPIVVCGKLPEVFTVVKGLLEPEYEVIHSVLSADAGRADIPALLSNQSLPPRPAGIENLGTGNYTRAPAAVVVGGMHDDETSAHMRAASESVSHVPWLYHDHSKTPSNVKPGLSGYPEHVAARMKERLNELVEEGKMEGHGVYKY